MFKKKSDRTVAFILLVVSICTHFFFFGKPAAVVFDEVYNGSFISAYSTHQYYFDVHPPFPKLVVKFFGDLIGAPYNVNFGAIGNTLPWGVLLLRLLPLLAGTLLPVVIYFICRRLSFSKLTAFAGGMLVILENSLLTQSRFILFDSILLLAGFSAVLLYLMYTENPLRKSLLWASALCAACAFSTKWTGLAFPLLLLLVEIIRTKRLKDISIFFGTFVLVGGAVYLAIFAIHLSYLTHSGPGDAFMSDRFQSTLVGNVHFGDAHLKPKGFFGKTLELNAEMYEANRTLTATHSYSSPWYTWPLMVRPIFYWQGNTDTTGSAYIYFLGNPLIYWLGAVSVLFILCRMVLERNFEKASLFIVGGFLVNFLPFMFIGRIMFIYIYEPALVFSILAICCALEQALPAKKREMATVALIVLCAAAFIYFSPFTYGFHLTSEELRAHMWLPTWR